MYTTSRGRTVKAPVRYEPDPNQTMEDDFSSDDDLPESPDEDDQDSGTTAGDSEEWAPKTQEGEDEDEDADIPDLEEDDDGPASDPEEGELAPEETDSQVENEIRKDYEEDDGYDDDPEPETVIRCKKQRYF